MPAKISDDIIKRAALFRSKSRFISICWKNPKGSELIARCSQPLAGITRGRNWFDEEIVKEISEVTKLMTAHEHLSMTDPEVENTSPMMTPKDAEISETYFDDTKSNFSDQSPTLVSPISLGRSRVMIFDARPLANAFGNAVIGGGWESTDYYKDVDFRFGDIPNIHAVRESFHGYRDLWLIKLDSKPPQTNDSLEWATRYRDLLKDLRSNRGLGSWFSHLSKILSASSDIATWIAEKQKSAIIHCSDGWDRASQLTSTTQLLLDPYYRTITGFIVLIEKEWVSYGYKFAQRFGFGSFKSDSSDKQRSPVFIQWLDCVFQLLYQFPREFEFTPQFLVEIADLLYSARFGTFLENCEKNRKQIEGETISLWSHALENKENFTNSEWNNEIQTVPLIPATATEDLQIWLHFYNRWDYALIRSQVKAEDILLHLT